MFSEIKTLSDSTDGTSIIKIKAQGIMPPVWSGQVFKKVYIWLNVIEQSY